MPEQLGRRKIALPPVRAKINELIAKHARTYERDCFTTTQYKTRTVVGSLHLVCSPSFIHESDDVLLLSKLEQLIIPLTNRT